MSNDPREILQQAQRALAGGDLRKADASFQAAANLFAGPAELLGAGHGWRGQAQVAIQLGALHQARTALDNAAALYQAGRLLLAGIKGEAFEALAVELQEGVATTKVMDADALLRLSRFREARKRIDEAYPLYQELGERPSVSDLWTVTARLSEREGRWFAARTAWTQVLRSRKQSHDEPGQCDALIRMAEAMVAEGEPSTAEDRLDEAERLARELEDRTLRGRVSIARARLHELAHDWPGAWEKWQDAVMDLRGADPIMRGLAMVRMARTAAMVQPHEAGNLLEDGLHELLEGEFPDAVGLVLHQFAVVALIRGLREPGALAAVGAEKARGGWDPSLHGLLFRALVGINARKAARLLIARNRESKLPVGLLADVELPEDLDLSDEGAVNEAYWVEIESALTYPLRRAHLAQTDLGSRRMVTRLTGGVVAPPTPQSPEASLELVWELREGDELTLALHGVQLIGRGGSNAVRMTWDALASRSHCVIEERDAGVFVRDLNSQHGTYLDGHRLTEERRLQPGHQLRIGDTTFSVRTRVVVAPKAQVAIAVAAP